MKEQDIFERSDFKESTWIKKHYQNENKFQSNDPCLETIAFRITPTLHNYIRAFSQYYGITKRKAITQLIWAGIKFKDDQLRKKKKPTIEDIHRHYERSETKTRGKEMQQEIKNALKNERATLANKIFSNDV